MRSFSDLTEQEILALAISSEDDDARSYAGFAHALMDTYPASAKVFMEMAEEEHDHRRWLTELYQRKFGDFIPLIRRSDVRGFVQHTPVWLSKQMTLDTMRQRAEVVELENMRFYTRAAEQKQAASAGPVEARASSPEGAAAPPAEAKPEAAASTAGHV